MPYNYYELETPQPWRAGYTGEVGTPSYKAFYYDCADCHAHEPVIVGYLASAPDFLHIAVLDDGGNPRLALFCRACFDKRMKANATVGLCPICGERVQLTGRTTDDRLIGSCGDAFTDEQWLSVCMQTELKPEPVKSPARRTKRKKRLVPATA